jgi:hypothetical protein
LVTNIIRSKKEENIGTGLPARASVYDMHAIVESDNMILFFCVFSTALRPPFSSGPTEHIDDCFSQWNHPDVHSALSLVPSIVTVYYLLHALVAGITYHFSTTLWLQIVTMSVSTSAFHPLLRGCAGYLSSCMSSHVRSATLNSLT